MGIILTKFVVKLIKSLLWQNLLIEIIHKIIRGFTNKITFQHMVGPGFREDNQQIEKKIFTQRINFIASASVVVKKFYGLSLFLKCS